MSQKGFYIPSLDGIRAVAVLLVFFSHTGFNHIVPGGLGVTIFFFLSGYLITTLLRMEFYKSKTIALKNFYIRRMYRLFPPLYITLLVSLTLSLIGFFPGQPGGIGLFANFFHLTNYALIFNGAEGMLTGMTLLWSLAAEEHFYLIFPLVFLFLLNRYQLGTIAKVFIGVCLLVIGWRIFYILVIGLPEDVPGVFEYLYTYHATDARLDSLLYGCLMAVCFNPVLPNSSLHERLDNLATPIWMAIVGAGILAILLTLLYRDLFFRESIRYTIQGIAMFPLFYFAIIKSQHWLFKPLNWAPIIYIGKVSYTFYLSHYLFIYASINLFGDSILVKNIAGFSITMIFCTLMYYFVEKKFAIMRKKLHS